MRVHKKKIVHVTLPT